MEQMTSLLLLFAGLWIGGAVIWFITNQRVQQAALRASAVSEAERGSLNERLQNREAQVGQLRGELDGQAIEVARLRGEAKSESERRAAAEERSTRLAAVEKQLHASDSRVASLEDEVAKLRMAKAEAETKLEEGRKAADEKLAIIQEASEKFTDAFRELSAESLKNNNRAFVDMAKEAIERLGRGLDPESTSDPAFDLLVRPMKEAIDQVDSRIQSLEAARSAELASLCDQVRALATTQAELGRETAGLSTLLRSPAARGHWGQVQLRRIVELAGMLECCDFVQHPGAEGDQSILTVKLPNQRHIVVDSGISLDAYLDAVEIADPEQRAARLADHSAAVRRHLARLAGQTYWEQFVPQPEFVVAFLPAESFLGAALDHDPALIEFGVDQRVLLATPTTLIALLKAVSYGWRQEKVAQNTEAISELGRSLHGHLRVLGEHLHDLHVHLQGANASFNRTASTFETRVLDAARRFHALGAASGADGVAPPPIDTAPRSIRALEQALPSNDEEPVALA